jgi:TRAP-type mannitol/chloroaromatic compound transport system permease small subunit
LQGLLRLARGIDRFSDLFGWLIAALTLIMVLVGAWNVVGRFVGRAVGQNLTSNSLLEWQWYLFSMVFLLGAGYVLRHDAHVRVDVIYHRMTDRRRAIVNLLGTLLFLIPFCIMALGVTWNWFELSFRIRESSPDPGGLPRWPIKFLLVFGFGLLLLQAVSQLIKAVGVLTGHHREEKRDEIAALKSEIETSDVERP